MVIVNQSRSPNLLSYKYYIRKHANKEYGNSTSKIKHSQNIQNILRILALNGPMTTWDMAKIRFSTDNEMIRIKEKEYRRLLVGRTDRGIFSEGLLDLNLVLIDSISTKRNPGKKYRLSLFGILYSLDSLDFNDKEIDKIAENYALILPRIFGKWNILKPIIEKNAHNLKLLGKGLLFDNPNIINIDNSEFWELISYFNIKSNSIQSWNEEKLAEMISYWFFISLLYFPNLLNEGKKKEGQKMLKKIFSKDKDTQEWFSKFVLEAQTFYKERSKILESISIGQKS